MINSVSGNLSSLILETRKMADAADRISKAFDEASDVNLEKEMADSMTIEQGVKANIKSIQAQDDMAGHLLDIIG